jgi:hypothetical protein
MRSKTKQDLGNYINNVQRYANRKGPPERRGKMMMRVPWTAVGMVAVRIFFASVTGRTVVVLRMFMPTFPT